MLSSLKIWDWRSESFLTEEMFFGGTLIFMAAECQRDSSFKSYKRLGVSRPGLEYSIPVSDDSALFGERFFLVQPYKRILRTNLVTHEQIFLEGWDGRKMRKYVRFTFL